MTSLDAVAGMDFGTVPTTPMHEPVADDHKDRIRIMADRWANGEDIWTGLPLTPHERMSVADDAFYRGRPNPRLRGEARKSFAEKSTKYLDIAASIAYSMGVANG
jgi:hypothetical protein